MQVYYPNHVIEHNSLYFIASYEKGLKRLERYLKTLDPGSTTATEGLSNEDALTKQYVSNILRRKTTADASQSGKFNKDIANTF